MKRLTSCRVCGNKKIKQFINLGNQPYANSLLKNPAQKEKSYPLALSYCLNCSLVQLNHTADPKELFSNYVWVTATSSTAKTHAENFCKETLSRVNLAKEELVLELASNDGTFLIPFIKKGYRVLGLDPAQNIVNMAIKNGVPTECRFFGVKTAEKLTEKHGLAKIIIARNVIPHVANTHDFIEGMAKSITDDGLLALEVHYAKKIYEELHYDSIYHEHLCYFTVKNFERLLNKYDLYIEDIGTSPISGGSLIYYARKRGVKEKPVVEEYRKAESKIKLNTLSSWQDFAKRADANRIKLLEILNKYKGKNIVGYGASARSSTLLNYCGIGIQQLSVIADMNPLKQNLYTAGTHIPIKNPSDVMKTKPDFILILAWNFKAEIMKFLKDKYKYNNKYIIPLPNNPKIVTKQ